MGFCAYLVRSLRKFEGKSCMLSFYMDVASVCMELEMKLAAEELDLKA
jgi:hypothetical protein